MLIDFQDAVTASHLDPNLTHAVYYVDGQFANRNAVARQCPHAKLYGITVFGATGPGIFACDSETGDLDVPATLRWVQAQIDLGVELIVVYANLDRWLNGGLLAAVQVLERLTSRKIRKWVAFYNDVRQIQPWADAEQYADPGPVDRDVALANFFGDTPEAHTADPQYARFDDTPRRVFKKLRRERGQVELYDRLRAMQTPTYHPHRAQINFVRLVLAFYAGRIATVAKVSGWTTANRLWRYNQLKLRAKGQRIV